MRLLSALLGLALLCVLWPLALVAVALGAWSALPWALAGTLGVLMVVFSRRRRRRPWWRA